MFVQSAGLNSMIKYKVPTMKEIEAIPWNGFNVCSTFSGGGGSCLGYRMAGYRVLYANEFVEEACKTYKANHPNSFLDSRDIRTVTGKDILEKIGLEKGELDIFDGSPPCCAFSTAGKREAGWGKAREYSDGKKQVIDDLFFEYARLVNEIQPKVFIAENVSGLAKGKAKGYLKLIYNALKDNGYNVSVSILNAKFFGVPQSRERTIFIGVRNDLNIEPKYPKPRNQIVPLRAALTGLEQDENQRQYLIEINKKYATGKELEKLPKNPKRMLESDKYFSLHRESMYTPCSTVCASHGSPGIAGIRHPLEDRQFTIPELKRIMSIPDDFILTGTYPQQWERLGRMVPPLMMKAISETVRDEILCKIS